jgi:glycosyltransferase involved in cell wall biosynthesis
MVTQKKYMIYLLSKLDNIFVETKKMSNELFDMGLLNVSIVPNFKRIRILDKKEMPSEYNKPYKICTFSRVNYKKGITDAISVVKKINRNRGEIKFKLDIYGQIDQDFFSEFNELLEDNSVFVEYCGVISPKASSEVIKDYFMLLFPTRYKTEGIPGTLIDAYAAGVPVIGSNWDSAEQIIKNNVTGYIYEFENIDHLYRIMEHTLQNPDEVLAMKDNCLEEANMYSPENALENMMVKLDL